MNTGVNKVKQNKTLKTSRGDEDGITKICMQLKKKNRPRKAIEWIQSDHGNQGMTQKQMTADRSRASEVLVAVDYSSNERLRSQGALRVPLQQKQQQPWSREERDLLTNQLY